MRFLQDELHKSMEYEVPMDEFTGKLLMPSNPARYTALTAIINSVEKVLQNNLSNARSDTTDSDPPQVSYDISRKRWLIGSRCPNGYAEDIFLPYFCELFNELAALARRNVAEIDLPQPDRVYLENRTRFLEGAKDGPQAKRKLDWYVCDRSTAGLRWDVVQLYAEMKSLSDKINDEYSDFDLQMAGYAREIFHAQPSRTHVHGLFLRNATVWLYRWDRLGALVSKPFDFHEEWATMLRVVLTYVYMDIVDLGHSPYYQKNPDMDLTSPISSVPDVLVTTTTTTSSLLANSPTTSTAPRSSHPLPSAEAEENTMKLSKTPAPGLYSIRIGGQNFKLTNVLDRQKSLVGRATACWIAKNADDADFLVKTAWPQKSQLTEEHFYRLAEKHEISGLMDLVECSALSTSVREDRRGIKGSPSRDNTQSSSKKKRKQSATTAPGFNEAPDAKRRRSEVASDDQTEHDLRLAHQIDRKFVAMAFRDSIGLPLRSVTSPLDMLKAIRSALDVHRRLYTKAGIIHGDISAYNILATSEKTRLTSYDDVAAHQPQGFLIDFDYSTTKDLQVSGANHRSGTLLFVAVSLLDDGLNTYRSDLESFFYVLCYVSTHYPAAEEQIKSERIEKEAKSKGYSSSSKNLFSAPRSYDIQAHGPLSEWVLYDKATIRHRKLATMEHKKEFKRAVLESVTPAFARVKPMLEVLRATITGSRWFMPEDLEERCEEASKKREEWVQDGKPPEREDPIVQEHRMILDEEDVDAYKLYEEMVKQIDVLVEGWEEV